MAEIVISGTGEMHDIVDLKLLEDIAVFSLFIRRCCTEEIVVLSGIVIAVGSVGVIFWRRAKKKLKDKVGIDFDKNKETEEEVVAVKTDDEQK